MEKFKGVYEVDDGYAGGSSPQYFTIHECDIEDDATDDDLRNLFQEEMQTAFEQEIHPYQKNEDEFVAWAKEQIAARGE